MILIIETASECPILCLPAGGQGSVRVLKVEKIKII